MIAIDGLFAGVATIGLASTNVTLTSPAAFTPTPGAGPTQAQNAILRFTGLLTANVTVTLPLPGRYLIENLTTGNFTVQFLGSAGGQRISTAQGSRVPIYNDGTGCYFATGDNPGDMLLMAGLSAVPSWVSFCTTAPWLLCDGSIKNFSDFPFLGPRLGSTFGGNGTTTFGVPDLRGRVPIAYDGTGARITVAGCGINGQILGASLDQQTVTLAANQIPTISSINGAQNITLSVATSGVPSGATVGSRPAGGGTQPDFIPGAVTPGAAISVSGTVGINVTYTNASQQASNNVQPSQVVGIWVIHT